MDSATSNTSFKLIYNYCIIPSEANGSIFLYQAVQYDKENGFSTWLSELKKDAVNVSGEVKTLFEDVIPDKNDNKSWLEIEDYIDLNGMRWFHRGSITSLMKTSRNS